MNDTPQVGCSLGMQGVLFVNDATNRDERVYLVSVSLSCPAGTNATVTVTHEGNDAPVFWSDAAMTTPLALPMNMQVDSVLETATSPSYRFYMSSTAVGSGTLTVLFTLPSGETRGIAKSYRTIEPIRQLVCCEIYAGNSCVYNPSRLVYGHPTRIYGGLFYFPCVRTTPCFEAFRAWNELAKLGTNVACRVSGDGVCAAAAKGAGGRAIIISNTGTEVARVAVSGADGLVFSLYRVDDGHDMLSPAGPWRGGDALEIPSCGFVLALDGPSLDTSESSVDVLERSANGLQQESSGRHP